jgi:hypothetical protein
MRFFFDRCMSIRLARMVNVYEVEHSVRHHDEDTRFTPATRDIEWIEKLAWKFLRVWPEIVANAATSKARLFEVSGGKALKVTGL